MLLTKFQRDEMLSKLQIRIETVEEDAESANGFEGTPGALPALEGKLRAETDDFTPEERAWLIEEAEDLISMSDENKGDPLWNNGLKKSMDNLIQKLKEQPFSMEKLKADLIQAHAYIEEPSSMIVECRDLLTKIINSIPTN